MNLSLVFKSALALELVLASQKPVDSTCVSMTESAATSEAGILDPTCVTPQSLVASLENGDVKGFKRAYAAAPVVFKNSWSPEHLELRAAITMYGDEECVGILIDNACSPDEDMESGDGEDMDMDYASFERYLAVSQALQARNFKVLYALSLHYSSVEGLLRNLQDGYGRSVCCEHLDVRGWVVMIFQLLKKHPELAPIVNRREILTECINNTMPEQLVFFHQTCSNLPIDGETEQAFIKAAGLYSGGEIGIDPMVQKFFDNLRTDSEAGFQNFPVFNPDSKIEIHGLPLTTSEAAKSSDYEAVVDYLARNVFNTSEAIDKALSEAARNCAYETTFLILLNAGIETGVLDQRQLTKFSASLLDYAFSKDNNQLKAHALRLLIDPSVSLTERLQILKLEFGTSSTISFLTLQLSSASEPSLMLPIDAFHLIGHHL